VRPAAWYPTPALHLPGRPRGDPVTAPPAVPPRVRRSSRFWLARGVQRALLGARGAASRCYAPTAARPRYDASRLNSNRVAGAENGRERSWRADPPFRVQQHFAGSAGASAALCGATETASTSLPSSLRPGSLLTRADQERTATRSRHESVVSRDARRGAPGAAGATYSLVQCSVSASSVPLYNRHT
jgi:hypothetical protein